MFSDNTVQNQLDAQLRRIPLVAGLTGIANRRPLDEALAREWARALRDAHPLALVMVDIDFFKPYTDHYGPLAGDLCLQQVAGAINAAANRGGDLATRYGGEEFAVILPGADIAGAASMGEKIRAIVAALALPHAASAAADRVTISVGAAATVPMVKSGASALIEAADCALYQAKGRGTQPRRLRGPIQRPPRFRLRLPAWRLLLTGGQGSLAVRKIPGNPCAVINDAAALARCQSCCGTAASLRGTAEIAAAPTVVRIRPSPIAPEPGVRLSLYTDLSLRLLVYLGGSAAEAAGDGKPVSTARVARQLNVSTHHMHKVAQGLRKLGYVETVSGRVGGLRLSVPMGSLRVGDVVEAMERSGKLVDCHRGPCSLQGACLLKGVLDQAERGFLDELNKYTLADLVRGPTLVRMQRLLRAA